AEMVLNYSEAMVSRWVAEIDALPTFAGLFAAALTAFNVESYQLLEPGQPAPMYAIVLNILWFSSLVLSLASGAMGIIVKQWLSEYRIGMSGLSKNSKEAIHRRQYRLINFSTWQVGFIVSALPVLLHVAFVLFL
ncbi:hypothetical protein C8Q76DRAFT_568443, partial [Earliella scabrosa]